MADLGENIWWTHIFITRLKRLQPTKQKWPIQVTWLLMAVRTKPQSPTS